MLRKIEFWGLVYKNKQYPIHYSPQNSTLWRKTSTFFFMFCCYLWFVEVGFLLDLWKWIRDPCQRRVLALLSSPPATATSFRRGWEFWWLMMIPLALWSLRRCFVLASMKVHKLVFFIFIFIFIFLVNWDLVQLSIYAYRRSLTSAYFSRKLLVLDYA